MFLLDDLLLKSIGIELPGLSLLWLIEQFRDMAMKELYDPEKIKAQITENRMLFEFGDITKKEYDAKFEKLSRALEIAERRR
jgi:hypothetical protein